MLRRLLSTGMVCAALVFSTAYAAETDLSSEESKPVSSRRGLGRRRLVILGGGWANVALLSNLKSGVYDISVVSPRNYHLFTPLLPSVAVGTVEPRTITEPMRQLLHRYHLSQCARFFEAEATDVDFERGVVRCVDRSTIGAPPFELPFDSLVIGIGATSNTLGVPGVAEHCLFLKDIDDARRIRDRICDCFETAALPSVSSDERKKLLSFVVVGGGPTGVEMAAELWDFIQEDLADVFPQELIDAASVTVVQSATHVLNTYDAMISDYTEKHFARLGIKVETNSRITEVAADHMIMVDKTTNERHSLPFGLCVWSTGIAPAPLVQTIRSRFPELQTNRNALLVNPHLELLYPRSEATPEQRVFAVGDCSSVSQCSFFQQADELFANFDVNKDGSLQQTEFDAFLRQLLAQRPDKAVMLKDLAVAFRDADTDGDGSVSLDEFKAFLRRVDTAATTYPATAQVANQQGAYVAGLLSSPLQPSSAFPAFDYHHLGSLAYVGGDSAVVDLSGTPTALQFFGKTFDGAVSMIFWRASYWNMQLSVRNKIQLLGDWSRTRVFGRDVSRV